MANKRKRTIEAGEKPTLEDKALALAKANASFELSPPEKETEEPMPQELIYLNVECSKIAGNKDYNLVVWRFRDRAGKEVGSSLEYYFRCREHEILTGEPCSLVAAVGQPVMAAMKSMPAQQNVPIALPKQKKCATC